jgi:hypothetical protein
MKPDIHGVTRLLQLVDSFHRVALRLRTRHANRTPFLIHDEYDVQDLFGALLETQFADARREEWGPSYAGGPTRVDFFLKNDLVPTETKMTRDGLTDRKLGEELIIDIAHYKQRSDCKALVCFVYDPEHRLKNPQSLENDLSRQDERLDVRVLPLRTRCENVPDHIKALPTIPSFAVLFFASAWRGLYGERTVVTQIGASRRKEF